MKKVICITGTNAVGKTSVAKWIINQLGGISFVKEGVSYMESSKSAILGDYTKNSKFLGVDGFGCTNVVRNLVKKALEHADTVFFEGEKCGTFGNNILLPLLEAEKSLFVLLYAPQKVINERLKQRTGTGIKTRGVMLSQKQKADSFLKYREIGIPAISFDTSKVTIDGVGGGYFTKNK